MEIENEGTTGSPFRNNAEAKPQKPEGREPIAQLNHTLDQEEILQLLLADRGEAFKSIVE
ncbi:MAG: hypothetical protein IKZ69_04055 [Lachnospiraceae bacterium]|nr:hypothetical protein [Lachnospiraceae bacterium]